MLWPRGQETFYVLVTTFHHAVVDVTNPDWIGKDEG